MHGFFLQRLGKREYGDHKDALSEELSQLLQLVEGGREGGREGGSALHVV